MPLFPGLTVFNEVGFEAQIWLGHGPINGRLNKRKVRSGPASDLQDLLQLRNGNMLFRFAFHYDTTEQWFSTAGTRPGTGTWRPLHRDLKHYRSQKCIRK